MREFAALERMAIPTEICRVINKFYPKTDEWDKQRIHLIDIDSTHFDDDTNTVTIETRDIFETRCQNIYGKYRIIPRNYISLLKNKKNQKDDDQKYKVIHAWKIKIMQSRPAIAFLINVGIVIASQIEAIEKDENNIQEFICNNGGYGVHIYWYDLGGSETQKFNGIHRGIMIEI